MVYSIDGFPEIDKDNSSYTFIIHTKIYIFSEFDCGISCRVLRPKSTLFIKNIVSFKVITQFLLNNFFGLWSSSKIKWFSFFDLLGIIFQIFCQNFLPSFLLVSISYSMKSALACLICLRQRFLAVLASFQSTSSLISFVKSSNIYGSLSLAMLNDLQGK